MLCHLSAFAGAVFPVFGNILGPLVVWLLRRKDSPFIDFHGRQSVNFQISLTIYLIVSAVLIVVKEWIASVAGGFCIWRHHGDYSGGQGKRGNQVPLSACYPLY